jgi:YD repeat-containing protein
VREQSQIGSADYHLPPDGSIPNLTPIDTDYFYDALGRLESVRDARGNRTNVAYDSIGRRTSIESPDTGVTEYRFDSTGNLGARITPNLVRRGGAVRYSYDRGRLTFVRYPGLTLLDRQKFHGERRSLGRIDARRDTGTERVENPPHRRRDPERREHTHGRRPEPRDRGPHHARRRDPAHDRAG